MKKLILIAILTFSVFANEIQVFTSNSLHVELDRGSKIKKMFSGTHDAFKANKSKILNDDLAKGVTAASLNAFTSVTSNIGNLAKGTLSEGLQGAGIAAVGSLAVVAVKIVYDKIVEDHEFMVVSIAVNSKGEKTMLQTLVVSNDDIELEEAEKIALEDQFKEIKD